MITANDITTYFHKIAPFDYALNYDNVGLLVGNGKTEVKKAMICVDITKTVAKEAANCGADLIVSHHPVIFNAMKKVRAEESTGEIISILLKNDIAALCLHTNLDAAPGGVSDILAQKLELSHIVPLGEGPKELFVKIRIFSPLNYRVPIINAMTEAGAGMLGRYDGCAYIGYGGGTFIPQFGANPYIGTVNERNWVKEITIEMICKKRDVSMVLDAMKRIHPYEEPAFDVFDIYYPTQHFGYSKIGTLPKAQNSVNFAETVKEKLSISGVRCWFGTNNADHVAVMPGAGGDFIADAVGMGADTVVVGELKHHEWLYLIEKNINILEIGHHQSEAHICDMLLSEMQHAFPLVETWKAMSDTLLMQYI